eukprot:479718-Prymnesium_polylepis.2
MASTAVPVLSHASRISCLPNWHMAKSSEDAALKRPTTDTVKMTLTIGRCLRSAATAMSTDVVIDSCSALAISSDEMVTTETDVTIDIAAEHEKTVERTGCRIGGEGSEREAQAERAEHEVRVEAPDEELELLLLQLRLLEEALRLEPLALVLEHAAACAVRIEGGAGARRRRAAAQAKAGRAQVSFAVNSLAYPAHARDNPA